MDQDIDLFLALANSLADRAGPIALRHYRGALQVDDKQDSSPVTIADREAERVMREAIARRFPDHGIIGEEHGSDRPGASHVWVLDPIDGTKSFITGRPLFGSLIALCRDGKPIVGVIDCPAMNERWSGATGRPTTHQGRAVGTRRGRALAQAALMATSPHMFEGADAVGFERLRRGVKFPVYGSDCYAYGLLASGFVDLVVEASLKVYDFAAAVPVIEGAGGTVTDWRGEPLSLASDGRVIAAGDDSLAKAARAALTH
jgi:inositol-phosphate phosphatase/L-galactose 1-phosphate phosphatase/histidinol-phosphatase